MQLRNQNLLPKQFDSVQYLLALHRDACMGEGDVAVILRDFFERAIGLGGGDAVAENFLDSNNVFSFFVGCNVFDDKLFAFVKFAAVHDVVDIAVVAFENDELTRVAVRFALSENAGTHNFCIVQNNEVARLKELVEIRVVAVGNFASLAIKSEQASSAANFWRMLSNDFLGKIVIKI